MTHTHDVCDAFSDVCVRVTSTHTPSYTTRDGHELVLVNIIDVEPAYYVGWNGEPDEDREPRCEGLAVGLNRRATTAIIAPFGKDVHSVELTPDQLRNLADWANAAADYLEVRT